MKTRSAACLRDRASCGKALGRTLVDTMRHPGLHVLQVATAFTSGSEAPSYARPASQLRLIQHKQEAYWFYRFLSIVYDHIVNPGHWTKDMREDALVPAKLDDPNLQVRSLLCTQHAHGR